MAPPQEPIAIEASTLSVSSTNKFTLQDLVQSIHQELGDEGLDSEQIDANRIIRLMEQYSSNSDDWSQYTLFDHSRAYTRNLIDDGNGKFNLMILAWSKGQKSPIHDHPNSHCVMKILDGQLQETLFDWPATSGDDGTETSFDITADTTVHDGKDKQLSMNRDQSLHVTRDTVYYPNQVTYVHDKIGLHRVTNPSQEHGAVSLHLYTPPYKVCKTFEETTGRARSGGVCTFYSIQGQRT
ncbi:RmlC-like cupin domain-containing protein [Sporodiniella umbellata]|nr:RmlC-like cupin domain-containing protein [Sporodiniella umbellata]